MTEEQKKQVMAALIALGIVYAAWKFAPSAAVKAAALGVGGVIVGKQLPYVKTALA